MQIRDNFVIVVDKITKELSDLENGNSDDFMALFNCRERLLLAKKDMHGWEQRQVQVEVKGIFFF